MTVSYDPDQGVDYESTDGMTFTWLCRRSCENFPNYTRDWEIDDPMTRVCPDYYYNELMGEPPNYGCFHKDEYNSSGESLTYLT